MTEHAAGPAVAVQRYRDVTGTLQTTELRPGASVDMPGGLLPARYVTRSDGVVLLQKWVPEDLGRLRPEAYERLDAEIRACAALGQRYGGPRYPVELPVLVGYNVDVAEPFVLLGPYRGDPLPERRMEYESLRDFVAGLMRALQHTAEAGVVHDAVGPGTVRWNGTTVQLVDFERAQGPGDRRRSGGNSPERSPEQIEGVGTVDPRDDVWAAGLLIWQLSLGPNADGLDAPAKVKTLLDRVFSPTAADRPSAREVLMRVDRNRVDPMGSSPDDLLAPGRAAFDEALARKRGDVIQPPPSIPPTTRVDVGNLPVAGTNRTAVVLAVVLAVTIVVVLLVLVLR